MLRYAKDDGCSASMKVTLDGELLEIIKKKAEKAQTSVSSWCREALDIFIREHRSGRYRPEPTRHWERNGCDADHVVE